MLKIHKWPGRKTLAFVHAGPAHIPGTGYQAQTLFLLTLAKTVSKCYLTFGG